MGRLNQKKFRTASDTVEKSRPLKPKYFIASCSPFAGIAVKRAHEIS